jgi:hypothetical protein
MHNYLHKSATCHNSRIHFTLYSADDLMGIRRGGLTEFLVLPGLLPAPLANKRNKAMTDSYIDQSEEEILNYNVSDEALEAAAGTMKDKAGAFTLAFCSGLDTCPA